MANYATQYCQALSQQYPNVLHFGALFARKQEGDYRWANAHTIEVPSVSVTAALTAIATVLSTACSAIPIAGRRFPCATIASGPTSFIRATS